MWLNRNNHCDVTFIIWVIFCFLLSFMIFRHIHKIVKKSSCPYVCPPFCMGQLGSHWMDFHEIWYLSIFKKSVGKVQVSLKYAINKGTIHTDQYTFLILSHSVLRVRNVSDISCGENQHTFYVQELFIENHCCLLNKVEKYMWSRADHRWQCGACTFHVVCPWLQTHAQNM
jgi:hypothetical protein